MKTLLLLFIFSLFVFARNAYADYGYSCGPKPVAPVGCYNAKQMCQCDRYRNCQWIYMGC